ncbi:hypothetical protein [Grimontia celer]|nr:hypothetical protein [Grimontia celer]
MGLIFVIHLVVLMATTVHGVISKSALQWRAMLNTDQGDSQYQ